MKSPGKFYKHVTIIVLITAALLMIPLIAMQFTNEVDWGLFDFVVAGVLLIGTGLTYELVSCKVDTTAYRAAVGIAVVASLLLIWVNLAVGIIGSEDNPANLMYGGVIAVGFIGAIITSFNPKGMATTLVVMTIVQILIPVIALVIWNSEANSLQTLPAIFWVVGMNLFLAMLFLGSALLFRKAARERVVAD